MSTASVLIAADHTDRIRPTHRSYSLLLSTDPELIDGRATVALRRVHLRTRIHPAGRADGRDVDRFDEHCDHLLVREDPSGELVGCYRMLPPPGAIAAGSLYTATEFDVRALDPLRPSLVEMGRAVVRDDHRNGGVVLLMWAGILAYLDRCDYDYVTGCVSVPIRDPADPGADPVARSAAYATSSPAGTPRRAEYTVYPYRPVVLDGRTLDEIDPPARSGVPPLMRGYLRLGAQVCGEPAHDPDFGVADFPALLDKRRADTRYLDTAAVGVGRRRTGRRHDASEHSWLPRAPATPNVCGRAACPPVRPLWVALRITVRAVLALALLPALPLLAIPMPGRSHLQRGYCRLVLRCLGVRITVSGGPIRNLRGVLVVSRPRVLGGHLRDRCGAAGLVRRQVRVDQLARARCAGPADEGDTDRPDQPAPAARRGGAGRRPGCGPGTPSSRSRRAPRGAAWRTVRSGRRCSRPPIDAARPVQPLRLTYHHRDGSISTVPAYIGDDNLLTSIRRLIVARRTIAHVHVESLQLPGDNRRDLAVRCETAVRDQAAQGHALAA